LSEKSAIEYEGVWSRVTAPAGRDTVRAFRPEGPAAPAFSPRPGPPPQESPGGDGCRELRRFMDGEARTASVYDGLRSATRDGGARRVFAGGARAARERLNRLRSEYFFRCGDGYKPAPPRPLGCGFACDLRRVRDEERRRGGEYARCADRTSGARAGLFREMSADAYRRAEALGDIARRLMT
jgi:hypothetical protein